MSAHLCNDYGDAPGCLKETDERLTMDFTDIGEGYIYWCSKCGAVAHAQQEAIMDAFKTRPEFQEEFAAAIGAAQQEQVKS